MKVLHISHTDLDGVTPIILDKLVLKELNVNATSDDYHYHLTHANALCDYLTAELVEQYDKIVITDLNISGDTLLKIIGFGLEKFYIADHHPIKYDLNASIRSFEKYADWTDEIIGKHVVITNTMAIHVLGQVEPKIRKTCGTEIYWERFLKPWLMKQNEICFSINMLCNIGRVVNAVRAWDTFDWKALEENSSDRVFAERLQILFSELYMMNTEEFENYIFDYIHFGNPYNLGFDIDKSDIPDYENLNCTAPINFIVNSAIDRKESYLSAMIDPENKCYQVIDWEIKTPTVSMNVLAALVFSDKYGSELASRILAQEESIQLVAVVTKNKIQLRSLDHLADCGAIANLYGGGGHHNAAAFSPLQQDIQWMQRNYFIGLCNVTADIKRD